MPEEAAKVHGLTIEVLEAKNAPPFAQVGKQIADFIRGAELIIHNAKFDVGFLNMEFRRMGLPSIEELGCKSPTRWPWRVKCFRAKGKLGCLV